MKKRMVIMLVLVGIVAGGLIGWQIFKAQMIKQYMSAAASALQTVSAVKAEYQEWQPKLDAVGTLKAVKGTDIATEVAGIVDSVNFDSGKDLRAEDVLVILRAEEDIAKLRALEATSKLAQITYDRDKKQFEAQAISQAQLDADEANLAAAKAQVSAQKAQVDKKIIYAPFSGRVGIRQVDVGQYISPGTVVATLQQLDPIYVDFFMPEQVIGAIGVGQKVTVKTEANPDTGFIGEISAINSKIETDTRNVKVRAMLKNPDKLLVPGMFAKVEVDSGETQNFLTLPQTAITFNPYGSTVYIVEEKADESAGNKLVVRQTFVTTGKTRGDQIAVLSGVNEGDTVVTSGQLKLRNGTVVKINNEIQPSSDPNPQPKDE